MDHLKKLRSELGDIHNALEAIHKDLTATTALGIYIYFFLPIITVHRKFYAITKYYLQCCFPSANNIEELLALEAKYGPLSGHRPAIDDVLNYLQQVCVL